jgi:hypothetical protein
VRGWRLVLALCVCAGALGQQPLFVFHGTWKATAGPAQVLHGTWTARTSPGRPNAVEGSWMLVRAGQVVLEGTWTAEKSHRSWEGSWTARTMDGRSLSGTWGAYLENWGGKTFRDLLEKTLSEEVSGWWQSGRAQGNWWLKGSPAAPPASPARRQKS